MYAPCRTHSLSCGLHERIYHTFQGGIISVPPRKFGKHGGGQGTRCGIVWSVIMLSKSLNNWASYKGVDWSAKIY